MPRAILTLLAVAASLSSTAPVAAPDVGGRSWKLLAPPPGQVELLLFLSTDCPISNRYVPEIVRLCNAYASRGVRCFTVYPDASDGAAVIAHRREFSFPATIPALIDRERRIVRAVGPRVTPEAAIYTSSGRVYRGRIDDLYVDVGRTRRAATTHDVQAALDAVLSGRSVMPSETEAIGCSISGS
jgi:hypothetical protein